MAFQLVANPSTDFSGHISRSKSQDVVSSDQTTASSRLRRIVVRPRTGHAPTSDVQHMEPEDTVSGCLWWSSYPGEEEYPDRLGQQVHERVTRKCNNDAKSCRLLQ